MVIAVLEEKIAECRDAGDGARVTEFTRDLVALYKALEGGLASDTYTDQAQLR